MTLVLFDVDLTLIHTNGAGRLALDRALSARFGPDVSTAGIAFDGRTDRAIFEEMLARSGNVDGFTYETLLAEYLELLPVALVELDGYVLPGVVELLDALQSAPVAVGLATGNVRAAAVAKLSHFSLWERFAAGGFGDDEAVRARLVESGLRALAAAAGREAIAAEAVVIGDTPLDIEAAHAIGARAGGVATGRFSVAELMAAGADWAVPDLSDTTALVAAILGGDSGQ